MIGSIFYTGDPCLNNPFTGEFDRDRALRLLEADRLMSENYGLPRIIDVIGETGEAMRAYIDFVGESDDARAAFTTLIPEIVEEWVIPYNATLREHVFKEDLGVLPILAAAYYEERVEKFDRDTIEACRLAHMSSMVGAGVKTAYPSWPWGVPRTGPWSDCRNTHFAPARLVTARRPSRPASMPDSSGRDRSRPSWITSSG